MHEIIKIASNQLDRTPDNQIVKVAGILRRLKNWLKTHFSPEFKEEVEKLEAESSEYTSVLASIKEQIEKVQEAIQDKELDEYKEELNKLKELLEKTSIKTEKNIAQVGKIKDFAGRKKSFIDLTPDIIEEYDRLMRSHGYDFPLNKIINKKFSDSEYYNTINYKNLPISITSNSQEALKTKLFTSLERSLGVSKDVIEKNINKEFYSNLANAILDGTIREVIYQKSTGGKSATIGHLLLTIMSDVFTIPNTNIKIRAEVVLIDPTLTNDLKFILRKTDKIIAVSSAYELSSLSNDRTQLYLNLIKTSKDAKSLEVLDESQIKAQKVPYTSKKYSPLEVARILESAYKKVFGKPPTLPILAFVWSQVTLENGRDYEFNGNNFGNVKADRKWLLNSSNLYSEADTKELTPEGRAYTYKAKWVAFRTLEEGAIGYLKVLKDKFPSAFKWIEAGDPESASVQLGNDNYYTALITQYTSGIKNIYDQFMKNYTKYFTHLSTEIKPVDEPRLEIKEREKFKSAPSTSPSRTNNVSPSEAEQLIKKLYSSTLTNLVKTAIYKIENPEKQILIQIEGSDLIDNLEYANNLNYLMQDYLNATTSLHELGDKIQIQAVTNTKHNLKVAATELSNLLSEEIKKKINKNVYTIIAEGLPTFAQQINDETINSNHRKFIMRYS